MKIRDSFLGGFSCRIRWKKILFRCIRLVSMCGSQSVAAFRKLAKRHGDVGTCSNTNCGKVLGASRTGAFFFLPYPGVSLCIAVLRDGTHTWVVFECATAHLTWRARHFEVSKNCKSEVASCFMLLWGKVTWVMTRFNQGCLFKISYLISLVCRKNNTAKRKSCLHLEQRNRRWRSTNQNSPLFRPCMRAQAHQHRLTHALRTTTEEAGLQTTWKTV